MKMSERKRNKGSTGKTATYFKGRWKWYLGYLIAFLLISTLGVNGTINPSVYYHSIVAERKTVEYEIEEENKGILFLLLIEATETEESEEVAEASETTEADELIESEETVAEGLLQNGYLSFWVIDSAKFYFDVMLTNPDSSEEMIQVRLHRGLNSISLEGFTGSKVRISAGSFADLSVEIEDITWTMVKLVDVRNSIVIFLDLVLLAVFWEFVQYVKRRFTVA